MGCLSFHGFCQDSGDTIFISINWYCVLNGPGLLYDGDKDTKIQEIKGCYPLPLAGANLCGYLLRAEKTIQTLDKVNKGNVYGLKGVILGLSYTKLIADKVPSGAKDDEGCEIDLTCGYKYNDKTNIDLTYARFSPGKVSDPTNDDPATMLKCQLVTKF